MSADLEWHEPTAEDFAKWEWSRLFTEHSPDAWDKLPQAKREDMIKLWEHSAANSAVAWRAAAYTLARAVDHERAVEEALERAQRAAEDWMSHPSQRAPRTVAAHRDALASLHEVARARVDELIAKVLGRQP